MCEDSDVPFVLVYSTSALEVPEIPLWIPLWPIFFGGCWRGVGEGKFGGHFTLLNSVYPTDQRSQKVSFGFVRKI